MKIFVVDDHVLLHDASLGELKDFKEIARDASFGIASTCNHRSNRSNRRFK
jgi:hypothetical protein